MKFPFPKTGSAAQPGLGWLSIMRLGLVQAALGSIVVLTTSTLNRVMVVELALAAVIPGLLVGLHYAVQISRPFWGHRSDAGGNRTRWVIGGVGLLAVAGTGASATTLVFQQSFAAGLLAAAACFVLIGFGIGAAGTSLLALLASRTAPARRPAAATIVWMMMIAGIVVTAIASGIALEPFSFARLIAVTAVVGLAAFVVACLALWGLERRTEPLEMADAGRPATGFRESLAETWADPDARLFTIFVFMSMLAYNTQDLILEPFGGLLFAMTPGETTRLSGAQHGGVFLGMAIVGIIGTLLARRKPSILRLFTIWGCVGSAVALAGLAAGAAFAPQWPLQANIFALGAANGAFAVAAIGSMMMLAGEGGGSREGIRMGVWGAAQAISFGLGGFLGTVAIDLTRALTGSDSQAFMTVFTLEAALFLAAAALAVRIRAAVPGRETLPPLEWKANRIQPAE